MKASGVAVRANEHLTELRGAISLPGPHETPLHERTASRMWRRCGLPSSSFSHQPAATLAGSGPGLPADPPVVAGNPEPGPTCGWDDLLQSRSQTPDRYSQRSWVGHRSLSVEQVGPLRGADEGVCGMCRHRT